MNINQQLSLLRRGVAEIVPESELIAKLETGRPLRVKLGVDPTAREVTLGWAVVLRKLRQFQDCGHEACLIMGDFTAQVGDPTGKSRTRRQLTPDQVRANAEACLSQLFKILDQSKTSVFYNADWLANMTLAEVVNLGAQYTVARLLERDDFARRLAEQKPLYVHEILYPLLQGRDSVEIRADVELSGTDQKFNNLVGRELQREAGQEPQVVLLMPLLVGTDGVDKMSQSLGNYIGINDAPFDMFGKVMSIPDQALRSYFELCTDVSLDQVAVLLAGHPMEAKQRLARELVTLYHSPNAATAAQAEFERVFSQHSAPTEIPDVIVETSPLWIVDLLRQAFGVTGNEARRLIQQGGVEIDGAVVINEKAQVAVSEGGVLRAGKRRFARIIYR